MSLFEAEAATQIKGITSAKQTGGRGAGLLHLQEEQLGDARRTVFMVQFVIHQPQKETFYRGR